MFKRRTCSVCGKVRKCERPSIHDLRYYWLCSECLPKVSSRDDLIRLRKERPKKERRPRFAYPCVGGPLDGEYATTDDFYEGMYRHLSEEYYEFNSAYGRIKRIGGFPSMIFVHKSVLKPLISPKER